MRRETLPSANGMKASPLQCLPSLLFSRLEPLLPPLLRERRCEEPGVRRGGGDSMTPDADGCMTVRPAAGGV